MKILLYTLFKTTNSLKRILLYNVHLFAFHSAMFSILQAYGGDFKTLSQVVCSLEFISNKCRLGLGNVLLEDYQEKGESETF